MAEIREVRVPDVGDTDDVAIAEIIVSPGDRVAVDDSLVALESDKASMDVPSPVAGTVKKVEVSVGDQVQEGDVLMTVEVEEGGAEEKKEKEAEKEPEEEPEKEAKEEPEEEEPEKEPEEEPEEEEPEKEEPEEPEQAAREEERIPEIAEEIDEEAFRQAYASPAVRRFARELGVDLGGVKGTGRKGRITKEDVRSHVKEAMSRRGAGGVGGFDWPEMPEVDFSKFGPTETRELSKIRKLSARNLHRSWLHAPHVTQHDEADVTELEQFRKAHSERAKKDGFKLTPLAFLLKAAAAALRDFPDFNSSLHPSGEKLVLKKYYHLGVAVDTPDGLVVPVIRDVDQKGIFELARELGEVSAKAREKKLKPQDFQGATFTISSLGGIGGTAFTPIVNTPEVAILGVSRMEWKPVWRNDDFVPRLMLPLSLSYDHRVIDGASACRFVVHLAELLGDLRRVLL